MLSVSGRNVCAAAAEGSSFHGNGTLGIISCNSSGTVLEREEPDLQSVMTVSRFRLLLDQWPPLRTKLLKVSRKSGQMRKNGSVIVMMANQGAIMNMQFGSDGFSGAQEH